MHRTFQEYLAGEEAMQDGQVETLVAHAHQDSWTQTIVLACGHGQRAQVSELLTEVLDRADCEPRKARRLRLLAAACLETVRDVDADVHDRIDTIIKDRLVPPRSKKETTSLATIGHRVLRYLPASLDGLSDAAAGATVRSAALVGSPEAMSRLAGYARDPRENVQEALVDAWLNFDPAQYAEVVLADAPLDEGYVEITTARLIPHLSRLRHLAGVDLFLSYEEPVSDLRFVGEVARGAVLHRQSGRRRGPEPAQGDEPTFSLPARRPPLSWARQAAARRVHTRPHPGRRRGATSVSSAAASSTTSR